MNRHILVILSVILLCGAFYFNILFFNFCNRMFYSTAAPACSLLTILILAQMYKLYILYFAISCH